MEKAGKGDVIGKVEVPIQNLLDQKQHEQWYPLADADAKQYIAGEVHLKLEYKPESNSLLAQVVGAKNLAPKGIGGTSNPFIRLNIGKKKKKTKTINRTLCPTYNELFEFKIKSDDPDELIIMIWHKDIINMTFMGKIVIPYKELEPNFLYDGWYVVTNDQQNDSNTNTNNNNMDDKNKMELIPKKPLTLSSSLAGESVRESKQLQNKDLLAIKQTRGRRITLGNARAESNSEKENNIKKEEEKKEKKEEIIPSQKEKQLGDIRLVLKYTEEVVLPDIEYLELLDLLKEDNFSIIRALGKVTNEKEDVGRCISQVFEHTGKVEDLIICLTCDEVENTSDPEVLFRANSLATKTFDYYLKLIGLEYLHSVLENIIKDIYSSKKSCELDPTRLEKTEDIQKNLLYLQSLTDDTCTAIFNSLELLPHKIRRICTALQNKVQEIYPKDKLDIVKYTCISGFLFLRFFCASILGPKLFNLMKDHPDMKTSRNLTLLAKTIQNLSNLCEFGYKEVYMKDMNDSILKWTLKFKEFIDNICVIPDPPRREESPTINYGREMATVHRHILSNYDALSKHTSVIIYIYSINILYHFNLLLSL